MIIGLIAKSKIKGEKNTQRENKKARGRHYFTILFKGFFENFLIFNTLFEKKFECISINI